MGTIELRMPNINGTEREQLVQIRSYLYQIIPQLQWALNNVNAAELSSGAVQQIARQISSTAVSGSGGTSVSAEVSFERMKELIIKSAEIVDAYYEKINEKLSGLYVAESDFGTFVQKTEQDIEKTSTYTDQKFSNVQLIITDEIDGVKASVGEDMSNLNTSFNNALGVTDQRITEEVAALNSSIDDTNEEIGNVNSRIDVVNILIGTTNGRIDETNTRIGGVEEAVETTNARIDDVNTSIAETNEEIRGVNNLITEANGKIDGLTESINDTNDNIDILIEAKNLNAEDVEKLNTELSKINGSIDEINTTVEGIDTEVKNIDGHVKEVDGQIVDINGSVANVEELAAGLNESVGKAEQSIKDTNAKVDDTSGTVENLKVAVDDTSGKVATLNSDIEAAKDGIKNLNITLYETTANTRSGLLDDTVVPPVYGFEIGQRNTVNGVETFNKYARFTADRLTFYDKNGHEVAYISDYKLYITNAEITETLKLGRFLIDTTKGLKIKWAGGEG